MKKFIAIAALFAAAAVPAVAKKPAHPTTPAPAALVCPVTGEKIASVAQAAGHSTFKGKTYYFCCGGCKPMFDKNPAKYVKSASK